MQTAFIMLYESGISPFQLRIMLLLWANSFIKACSMEANPFECFVLLAIAMWPVFDVLDKNMLTETQDNNERDL